MIRNFTVNGRQVSATEYAHAMADLAEDGCLLLSPDALAAREAAARQAGREEVVARVEALAARIERRARWKFNAGERLWRSSNYGKNDDPMLSITQRPGASGLRMCTLAGQMERDAAALRALVAEFRAPDATSEARP